MLEFTLNNGVPAGDVARFKEDRPGSGPVYSCPFPGSFKLAKGMLRPFPRGAEARIMLVRAGGAGREGVGASGGRAGARGGRAG